MRTFALALSLVAAGLSSSLAVEHRHDAFAKTVLPFLNIFAKERKTEDRAFALKIRIEDATNIPKDLLGKTAEISVQTPDKLRLHGPLFDDTFTMVRDGVKIWIDPREKALALLKAAAVGKQLPPGDKKAKLSDFSLPFAEKNLVFLPALFSVKDLGFEMLDGVECRALDVTLMPELAEKVNAEGWIARIWITPDHKPARVTVARKGWHVVARIEDVQFARELSDDTWKPASTEERDVLELTPSDYGRFLGAIWGEKAKP